MLPKAEFDAIVQNTERVKWAVLQVAAVVLDFVMIALIYGVAWGATYGLEDQSGNKLTLHEEPCSIGFLKGWKRASFRYEGKDLTACWMASKGLVYVLDDLGDLTPVPITMFKKLQEG